MTNNQIKIIERFIQLGLIDDNNDIVEFPFVYCDTYHKGVYQKVCKTIIEIPDIADWNPSLLVMNFDGNTRRYYTLV